MAELSPCRDRSAVTATHFDPEDLIMRLKSMMACVAVAVMGPAALVACGSSSSTSGSSTTSKSTSSSTSSSKDAVCTAADNLKQSMKALTDPSLLTGGKSGIESAVSKVKSDFSVFESAAKGSYQTQTDAMKSSLDQLETAVGDLGNGNVTQNIPKVGTAIAAVGSSFSSLESAVTTKCG